MDGIRAYIEKLKRDKTRRRRLAGIFCVLAMFVAGGVFWRLRIIGLTKTVDPLCGVPEHTHTEECISEKRLICGFDDEEPEMVLSCGFTVHTHSPECYDPEGNLVCGYADYVIHTHDESCFDEDGLLVCTLPEISEHIHDAGCYILTDVWSCGLNAGDEVTIHTHTDDCYELQKTLVCGLDESDEHTHGEECYEETLVLVCEEPETAVHVHDENCILTQEAVLICGLPEVVEHTHTAECFDSETGALICCRLETYSHQHGEECMAQVKADYVCSPVTHVHTSDCFDENGEAVCGYADYVIHTHDENCYDENGSLLCTLPEISEHVHSELCYAYIDGYSCGLNEGDPETVHIHTDDCYAEALVCGLDESEEHTHTEECYGRELICTLAETQPHVHDENCVPTQEAVLICGLPEVVAHTHTAECFDSETGALICGQTEVLCHQHTEECRAAETEAHVHTDECYEIIYGCGMEEHVHNITCYSDINRDVETLSDWQAMADEVYAQLMEGCDEGEEVPDYYFFYALASSQIGYTESEFNFTLVDGARKGYNRYSDWFTGGLNPYTDWNASFVQFCLHFAGIDNVPQSNGVHSWQVMLENANMFLPVTETALYGASDKFPSPGDIIFVDTNGDGIADRVGVIADYGEDDYGDMTFVVIEGDCSANGENGEDTAYSGMVTLGENRGIEQDFDDIYTDLSELELDNLSFGGVEDLVESEPTQSYVYESIVCDSVDLREYSMFDEGIIGFVSIAELPEAETIAAYNTPRAYNELAYEDNYQGGDVVTGDYSDLSTLGNFALVNLGNLVVGETTYELDPNCYYSTDIYSKWEVEYREGARGEITLLQNSGSGTGLVGTKTSTPIELSASTVSGSPTITYNSDGTVSASGESTHMLVNLPENLSTGDTITLHVRATHSKTLRFYLTNDENKARSGVVSVSSNGTSVEQDIVLTVTTAGLTDVNQLMIKGSEWGVIIDGLTLNEVAVVTQNSSDSCAPWELVSLTNDGNIGAHYLPDNNLTNQDFKNIVSAGGAVLNIEFSSTGLWTYPALEDPGFKLCYNFANFVVFMNVTQDPENTNKYTATVSLDSYRDALNTAGVNLSSITDFNFQPQYSDFKVQKIKITNIPLNVSLSSGVSINKTSDMQVKLKQTVNGTTYYLDTDSSGKLVLNDGWGSEWNIFVGSEAGGTAVICKNIGEGDENFWKSYYLIYGSGSFSTAMVNFGGEGWGTIVKPPVSGSNFSQYDFSNINNQNAKLHLYSSDFLSSFNQYYNVAQGTTIATIDILNTGNNKNLHIAGISGATPGQGTTSIGPAHAMIRLTGADWYITKKVINSDTLYQVYTLDSNGNEKYISITSPEGGSGEFSLVSDSNNYNTYLRMLSDYSHQNGDDSRISSRHYDKLLYYSDGTWTAPSFWSVGSHSKFYFYDTNGNRITSVTEGETVQCYFVINNGGSYSPITYKSITETLAATYSNVDLSIAATQAYSSGTIDDTKFSGIAPYANWTIEKVGNGLYNIYTTDVNGNNKYISLAPYDEDGEAGAEGARFTLADSGSGDARVKTLGSNQYLATGIAPSNYDYMLSYIDGNWTTKNFWDEENGNGYNCGNFYFYKANGDVITSSDLAEVGSIIKCALVLKQGTGGEATYSPIGLTYTDLVYPQNTVETLALTASDTNGYFGKSSDYDNWYIERTTGDNGSLFKIYTYDPNGTRFNLAIYHVNGNNSAAYITTSTGSTSLRALGSGGGDATYIRSDYYGVNLAYDSSTGSWTTDKYSVAAGNFYFYGTDGNRITLNDIGIGQSLQCSIVQMETVVDSETSAVKSVTYYPIVFDSVAQSTTSVIGASAINVNDYEALAKAMVWDAINFTDNNVASQNRIRFPSSSLYIPIENTYGTGTALKFTDVFTGANGSKFDFIPVTFNDGTGGKNDYVLIRSLGGGSSTNEGTNYYLAVDGDHLVYRDYASEAAAQGDSMTHFRIYIDDPRDVYNEDDAEFIPNDNKTTVKPGLDHNSSNIVVTVNLEVGEEFSIDILNSIFKPNSAATSAYCSDGIDAVEANCMADNVLGITYYYSGDSSVVKTVFESGTEEAGTINFEANGAATGSSITANVCDTIHITGVADGTTVLKYKVYVGSSYDKAKGEYVDEYKTLTVYVGVGSEKVYAGESNRYYHLDVEVDADFDILIYGAGGTVSVVKPQNVQVQTVYAKVYNTAALIGKDLETEAEKKAAGMAVWTSSYYKNPTASGLKPYGGIGGYVNPWEYPWLLYKASDGKYYPVVDGTGYAYDQYVYVNPGSDLNSREDDVEYNGVALKAFLDETHTSAVKLSDISKYIKYDSSGKHDNDGRAIRTAPDPLYYNDPSGNGEAFKFGTYTNGTVITDPDDKINTTGYTESDTYNGEIVQSVYVGYNQRGSSANGQFEFLTYGWGWMQFFDGDTVELYVTVSYDYNGKTYYTQRKVVTTICDANNVCPSTYDNWLIHGFDVEVIFDDVVEIESTGIYKSDQYGDPVKNATFQLFKSNANGEIIGPGGAGDDSKPVFEVTTDANGKFQFTNSEGTILTMAEFYDAFGFGTGDKPYFIMRETRAPSGYRMMPDKALFHFVLGGYNEEAGVDMDPTGSYTFVVCDNSYTTGVRANPNALVQAPFTLTDMETDSADKSITYVTVQQGYVVDDNGTPDNLNDDTYLPYEYLQPHGSLYAVVLKRRGADALDFNHYTPVYGNDFEGYEFEDLGEGKTASDAVKKLIIAANADPDADLSDYGVYKFDVSSSGATVVTSIANIPGDITQYYNYQMATSYDPKTKTSTYDPNTLEYIIAYFYQDADGDITRVKSDYDYASGTYADDLFDIHWTTTIEVPDIENRLFFTKKDTNGNLLDGAYFALYNVDEFPIDNANTILGTGFTNGDYLVGYRAFNNDYYYLYGYDGNNNTGYARKIVNNGSTYSLSDELCTYYIDQTVSSTPLDGYDTYTYSGQIRISSSTGTIYINPAENTDTDGGAVKRYVGYTHDNCDIVGTNGTGHFGRIPEGKYVLREILSPAGYSINTAETLVLVDALGVYANAGSSDNGVRVGNGVGYLVSPMNAYASEGSVNESLAWIYMHAVKNGATTFNGFGNVKTWANNTDDVWGVKGENASPSTGVSYLVYDSIDPFVVDEAIAAGALTLPEYEDNGLSLFDYRASRDQRVSGDTVYYFNPIEKTYESYKANFNRTVPGIAGDGAGSVSEGDTAGATLVMYNTQGWSAVRIFQDYFYGSVASSQTLAKYDTLTTTGKAPSSENQLLNLTDLYSGSTFVEYTDEASADLILVKTFDDINDDDYDATRSAAAFTLERVGTTYNLTTGLTARDDGKYYVALPDSLNIADDTEVIVSLTGTANENITGFSFYFNPQQGDQNNNVSVASKTDYPAGSFAINKTVTIDYQTNDQNNTSGPRYIIFATDSGTFDLSSISITVKDGTSEYYTTSGEWVTPYNSSTCDLYTSDIYVGNESGLSVTESNMHTANDTTVTKYVDISTYNESGNVTYQAASHVTTYTYYSELCSKNQSFGVLLPPGYDSEENKNTKYPVMYVLHGWEGWCGWGYEVIGNTLYNMMEDGVAEKMIVVFPTMFSSGDPDKTGPSNPRTDADEKAYDRFLEVLTTELMPIIEGTSETKATAGSNELSLRVKTGKDNTAVYGWSMGGREAMAIGFNYPDKFGYVCACEPAPGLLKGTDYYGDYHEGQLFNEGSLSFSYGREPYLFMICAGINDNVVGPTTANAGVFGAPKSYDNIMDTNVANGLNADHIYYEVDSYHGEPATYISAYNFGKYVFKHNNHNQGIRFEDLTAGTYIIKEVVTPDGYAPVSDMTVTVTTDGKISVAGANTNATAGFNGYAAAAEYTLPVENISKTTDISIQKVDNSATPNPLTGAEFILYSEVGGVKNYYTGFEQRYDASHNPTIKVATWSSDKAQALTIKPTAENGTPTVYSINGLTRGETYYLVETKAPPGYNLLPTPIELIINSDGKLVDSAGNVISNGGNILAGVATHVSYNVTTGVITINVINTPGYELPESGGSGTLLYTLFGGAMMILPIIMGYARRRRERRAAR